MVEKYCSSKSDNLDVPAFLAGLRVERDEVVVRRFKEEIVVPDADTAIGDVRSAARFPVVVPELAAVARVERPDVIGRGGIEDAVHHEDGALFGDAARRVFFESFTADDRARAGCRVEPADPSEREVLDRVPIDLLERAVSPAGVVAGVRRPGIRQRFQERRGIESAFCLRGNQRRQDEVTLQGGVRLSASFQGHQVSGHVVNVFVRVFGQQLPMRVARIADFDFWVSPFLAERSGASVFQIEDHDEVIDAVESPFDLLATLQA